MIYAIDYGTSNSLLTAAEPGKLHSPIPLDPKGKDPTILRSVLYFPNMSKVFYGAEAIHQYGDNQGEGRLIRSIKKQLPNRSFIGTWIDERPLNLEDIIGLFLAELRKRANQHFQKEVDAVVLGRPAKFAVDDADDKFAQFRLEQAAKKAGFKTIHFCPEPIAAAHEFRTKLTREQIVLVADFGGGTSDYTVIKMGNRPYDPSDVLSLGGVSVAGDAFDGAIMRSELSPFFGADVEYKVPFGNNVLRMPIHLMERICSPAEISFLMKRDILDFLRNVKDWSLAPIHREKLERLLHLVEEQLGFHVFEHIEVAKRELSNLQTTTITLDHPALEITKEVARSRFDAGARPQVEAIISSLDATLAEAGITADKIDVVCCTGGTARVPAIHAELVKRFGESKIHQHNHFHSVAEGLARTAQSLL